MPNDPSGKFARISTGELPLPAICAGCGKIEEPNGFVDTKLQFEFYGAVVFCCDCAFEMTTVFDEAPYHTMRARILALESDVISKDATIASLERALDGLTSARLTDRGITLDSISDHVADYVHVQDEPEPGEPASIDDSGTALVESILLNQVRTQDPYTLLSPNAATKLSTSDLVDEGYISHTDEAEAKRFSPGIGDELTQDDFAAFGDNFFPQEEGLIR